MNSNDLSRRGFLSTAVGVGGMGANSAPENPQQYPEQAWFIVEQHWEHNDEFFVPDGEYPQFYVYYSEGEALAECQRLNDEFFATEQPAEYPIEVDSYLQSET